MKRASSGETGRALRGRGGKGATASDPGVPATLQALEAAFSRRAQLTVRWAKSYSAPVAQQNRATVITPDEVGNADALVVEKQESIVWREAGASELALVPWNDILGEIEQSALGTRREHRYVFSMQLENSGNRRSRTWNL